MRAREAIEHIRTLGLDRLNTTDLGQVRGQLAGAEGVSVAASATKAEGAVSRIKSAGLEPLNGASLGNVRNELSGEANSVASSAGSAERKVTSVHTEITQLNEASLSGLKATLDGPEGSLKESVQNVKGSVTRLGNAIRDLKDISFYTILGKFDDLKSSVMDTKDRVGLPSGKTGLNYALRKLNSVDYSGKGGAESKLNDLKAKVDEVTAAALLLKGALRDINGETDGGREGQRWWESWWRWQGWRWWKASLVLRPNSTWIPCNWDSCILRWRFYRPLCCEWCRRRCLSGVRSSFLDGKSSSCGCT
ncbi:hypothetical protein GCM10020221_11210 [Streptomyces thioluteus]|uniref:Uncharacterized protein n=1 Tax=Streptomyces thioluteus TaxID=66431 RepID=A0ABP6J1H9_STRTU